MCNSHFKDRFFAGVILIILVFITFRVQNRIRSPSTSLCRQNFLGVFDLPEKTPKPDFKGYKPIERYSDNSGSYPFIIYQYQPFTHRIDINHADKTLLAILPGIGKATAESIIIKRTVNGPFQDIQELLEVPGIGPSTIDGIESLVCFR